MLRFLPLRYSLFVIDIRYSFPFLFFVFSVWNLNYWLLICLGFGIPCSGFFHFDIRYSLFDIRYSLFDILSQLCFSIQQNPIFSVILSNNQESESDTGALYVFKNVFHFLLHFFFAGSAFSHTIDLPPSLVAPGEERSKP